MKTSSYNRSTEARAEKADTAVLDHIVVVNLHRSSEHFAWSEMSNTIDDGAIDETTGMCVARNPNGHPPPSWNHPR